MKEITVVELKSWLEDTNNKILPIVLDVRDPLEHNIANLKFAKLVPMNEIPSEVKYLDKNQPYICMCHHGLRSMKVALFLKENGFKKVFNLLGGIESWSNLIDDTIPTY